MVAVVWQVDIRAGVSKEFEHLSAEDRQNIMEILVATKAGLPAYFQPRSGDGIKPWA